MTILDTDKLKQLQNIELDMLKITDSICNAHGIEYYLACGTLLGCIRHNGFIPWDDDLDIFMTRDNYNKFMALPKSVFPDSIQVRSFYETDESDPSITFQTKIEAVGKQILRRIGDNLVTQKIWIDIFLIDGMPRTSIGRYIHYKHIRFHHVLFRTAWNAYSGGLKGATRSPLGHAVVAFLQAVPIGKLLNVKCQMMKTEKILSKYPVDHSNKVITYVPLYRRKCIVDRDIFHGNRLGKFCGSDFPIPKGAESYLTSIYGDYMKLPPEEKRKSTHCEDIIEV